MLLITDMFVNGFTVSPQPKSTQTKGHLATKQLFRYIFHVFYVKCGNI